MKLDQMTKLEGGRYQDVDGCILPWYTSPCLEWLMTLDLKGKYIYEFGVGHSTLWYAIKGAHVYGVDSDKEWSDKCAAYHAGDEQLYTNAITCMWGLRFDIIIIDGLYRDQCTRNALEYLKQGGYLIIDNWKQPSVEPEWPLTEKLIEGMPITIYKEPEHYDWVTAVVQKP